MAALPSPTQVAGTNSAIYEAYYHQVDPNGSGVIQALDAARFLKKSRLSDVVLSKIWDLSDPAGRGYLDKSGLFTALKLVALAQAGRDINMSNIHTETPPPKVGELPKVAASPAPPPHAAAPGDWSVKPSERDKYNNLFDSLQPANGLIPGNKVKGVLMESKLPLETLGKIWDLADQDKDGMLDRHEFTVAMHLVYKALEKHAIPTCLPPELRARAPPARPPSRPPSRPASRPPSPQPARPPPPRPAAVHSNAQLLEELLDFGPAAPVAPVASPAPWVVTAPEKAQFDALFTRADVDRDGFVSGHEIRDTFLQSGLPQPVLAHIWGLCDWDSTGKLSSEQFALAMWLVARRLRGLDPPTALAPEMIPPSCRQQVAPAHRAPLAASIPPPEEKKPEIVSLGPQPTPELEAIAREIDALARERLTLEAEVQAKEREVKVKSSENSSLQSEYDTLAATLKQLENQKGEAQKRLNDLKAQVDKLRSQVAAQESAAAETEAEVAARRAAAATLRERERGLQDDVRRHEAEAEALNSQLRRLVLGISQANIKIQHLEEQERLMSEASAALAAARAGGAAAAHAHLSLAPQHGAQHLERVVRGATPHDQLEEAFEESAEFGGMNGSAHAHAHADPFKEAAFGEPAADPFAPKAGDNPTGFKTDPFARAFPSHADPFGGDAFAASDNRSKAQDNKDEFGSDPFAVLHAPTRAGSASPTPSLPPKKHKTPPPRPAPPRPAAPSAHAAPAAHGGFANFNNKWGEQATAAPRAARSAVDFAEDPFKDYRYEDPYNIEDPFADVTDTKPKPKADPFRQDLARPTSVAGFETDDFFSPAMNGSFPAPKRGGRVSAPTVSAFDPFEKASAPLNNNNNNNNNGSDSWAAWPTDNWATEDAWARTEARKTDGWASSDSWSATPDTDQNRNLNETWPSTLPAKKEKSPKSVKYARSIVHTIGGIGRRKQEKKKEKVKSGPAGSEAAPSEEQQWAWAAQESRRLEAEAAERRRREDAELQLALAISRSEK